MVRLAAAVGSEHNCRAMKRIITAAALSLAACATNNQAVLESPATQVFHSDQSVNKVAFCLADKNSTSALDQDDGSKVVLIKNIYGKAAMTFTIYPDGTGS